MPRMKGGDLISDFLIQEEVPYVFGICGHGNVGLLDALFERKDRIKLVSPRHEQVAAHMADAYFRVKHEAVATLTSCGPGSANIVEFKLEVPGRYVLVDHALSRAERGLAGYLIVEGDPNPEVFDAPPNANESGH